MGNHCDGCAWDQANKECTRKSFNIVDGSCPCTLCIVKATCLYNPCEEWDMWVEIKKEE